MRRVLLAALVLLGFACGWYIFEGPCGTRKVAAASATLRDIDGRWADQIKIVSTTPRVGLSLQVEKLQQLRREASAVPVPSCLAVGREAMVAGMNDYMDEISSFAGGAKQVDIESAAAKMTFARSEVADTAQCAPRCCSSLEWWWCGGRGGGGTK